MVVALRNRTLPREPEPRPTCVRCLRPLSVCVCAAITPVETKTRVVILQHPRERDVGIGTARIARLSLKGALLRCDLDFSQDPVVREVVAAGNAYVLFPGENALDVETAVFPSPITLVVVDGTWWQAEKLLKANPALAALPRLRMTPVHPSFYDQIRHEPAEHCVATIEAIAHVLGHLEGDHERFANLLRPFVEMVKQQVYFATEVATGRQRRVVVPRPKRDPIPALLRRHTADLVCVHGESNAWPHLHPERAPAETVHWLARRLSDGACFEAVIAPRGKLAPGTCRHIRLGPEILAAGESWNAFAARFRAFLRPTDVLVGWGHFPVAALIADGFAVEHAHVDVRPVVGNVFHQRTGTVEECAPRMGLPVSAPWAPGRGGTRLASLCAVVEKLSVWPLPGS